ncbi:alpha/beta hydrolase [Candidatus Saccharibacteria bacterium]|nr:MAG: alpha/beta hydrolase [Candidatus Saccharibacteria bacterium]
MRTWSIADFPVGFEQIHSDQNTNFQLNRHYNFSGSRRLLEGFRGVASQIHDFETLVDELIPLAQQAEEAGDILEAAFYYRAAEFVTSSSDSRKSDWRSRFRDLSRTFYEVPEDAHAWIPFGDIKLGAYKFTSATVSKGTVLFMNGFDGCLEEFMRIVLVIRDMGYDVIAFDGPGQGEVLERYKAPMTPEWERPTAAILDHFGLDDVTVIGCSLGGGLAVRAAAFEPRIRRVICFDVLPDLFESLSQATAPSIRTLLSTIVPRGIGRGLINSVIRRNAATSTLIDWGSTAGHGGDGRRRSIRFYPSNSSVSDSCLQSSLRPRRTADGRNHRPLCAYTTSSRPVDNPYGGVITYCSGVHRG